jgi:hypothetical protein
MLDKVRKRDAEIMEKTLERIGDVLASFTSDMATVARDAGDVYRL